MLLGICKNVGMRLNGEIPSVEEVDGEMEPQNYPVRAFAQPQEHVVGYALTPKKKKSFLKPKLVGLARYFNNPMAQISIFLLFSFFFFW